MVVVRMLVDCNTHGSFVDEIDGQKLGARAVKDIDTQTNTVLY